jgi:carboxylesterase
MNNKIIKSNPFFLKGSNGIGILLLHGWTSPPDEMRPLAEYLNSFGYTASAPLLRGHGTKPEDLFGVTWQDWLEDGRKALADLEKTCSNIFVGGISMGGDLAMLLAEEKNVSGIISLGAPIRFRFHLLGKAALFLLGFCKTYRKKYYPPRVRKKMGNRKVYPYYPVESAKEVVRLAEYTEKNLACVKKPILIMQSTNDHMVSKKSPGIVFRDVKSKVKEIYWVENGYHIFVDKEGVWEKIRDFIGQASNL